MSVRRDTYFNLLGNGIPIVAAALTIPYLLAKLGNENFGLLTLIWALVGYFGLFDMGIGRAMTYEVSRAIGEGHNATISKTIKAGIVLTMLTGIVGALLVYFAASIGGNLFKISPSYQEEARRAFIIISLAIVPTTITSGLRGAMEGFGEFAVSNITRVALGTLMFILPALSVALGHKELYFIAWYLVGARIGVMLYAVFQLRKQLLTKIKISFDDVKPLFRYGGWVTVSGIISPLMVYGDRFFVSMNLGAAALPFYAIPQEGLVRLLVIPTALTGALMPRLAQTRDAVLLKSMYSSYTRKTAWVMACVCGVAAILAYPVFQIWISVAFAKQTIFVVIILCLGIWVNSLAQLAATILHAGGRPNIPAILHIIELIGYCVLIMFFSKWFGIIGAAIAWTIRVVIDFVLLHLMAQKHIAALGAQESK